MASHHRRAVIDVGTNSVKLLVADVAGGAVTPVTEESSQTRLGEDFYADHRLRPEAIQRTAAAVQTFLVKARESGAESVRAFATSAAREAVNQSDLREALQRASGIPLEIISGDTEAEWGFRGVLSNPAFVGQALVILDLGGGSMQFILGHHGHAAYSGSFPLGCVRLLDKFRHADPPSAVEKTACLEHIRGFLAGRVGAVLGPHLNGEFMRRCWFVGVGGTATILGRMEAGMTGFDREQIEAVRMSQARVREWQDQLWAAPLARRKEVPGLPANRADVILMGAAIYAAVMEAFGFPELRLSTRGLRFGALLQ